MAQWGALVTQPNRAQEHYRDKDFPLDVSSQLFVLNFKVFFLLNELVVVVGEEEIIPGS